MRIKSLCLFTLVLFATSTSNSQDASKQLELSADLFKCLTEMTATTTGSYFVDNLLGDLDATLAVANSTAGGSFPPGSVISLIPSEVMVKHREGWNPASKDWEFIELTVSETGSAFAARGTTDVVNSRGGNCFGCHLLARPEWDFVCGTDHGCAPLGVTREIIARVQSGDPRCVNKD
jgi:hypothetical protein